MATAERSSTAATLAVINAKGVTQADGRPSCEAVAVRGGRIALVGTTEQVRACCGPDTVVIDAGGRTLSPGFIDAHAHWGLAAQSVTGTVHCPSPPYGSIAEIVEMGRRVAAETPGGQWIMLQGSSVQARVFAEGRAVTPADLDGISSDHPILYKTNLHQLVVNQRALRVAGIDESTEDPVGGVIERDEHGRPTGRLNDMYFHLGIPEPDRAQLRAGLAEFARTRLVAKGVTAIQEISDTAEVMALQRELIASREVPMRLRSYMWVPQMGTMREILDGRDSFDTVPGWFEFGGVKMFADGGTSSRTAAMHGPYPGTADTGVLTFSHEELVSLVREAHEAGAQLVIHATGDRGQDEVLRAYQDAGAAGSWQRRHRIEHAGNVLWTAERSRRFHELAITPVPNVGFLYDYAEAWPATLGEASAHRCMALRRMLDEGHAVAGSSDTTGGSLPALDPLKNIWRAVTRTTMSGRIVDPEEAITAAEGLRMYTRNSALVGRQLHEAGTLEPGKVADLVILSHDVLETAPDELADVQVDCTIVDGGVVYSRPGGAFAGLDGGS